MLRIKSNYLLRGLSTSCLYGVISVISLLSVMEISVASAQSKSDSSEEGYEDSDTETLSDSGQRSADDLKVDQFRAGGKTYPYGLQGFQNYLKDIKSSDAKLYSQLQPDLQSLISKKRWGTYVGLPSLLTGIGLLSWGIFRTGEGKSSTVHIVAGSAMAIGGGALFFLVRPSQRKIWDFMQKHNRINSKAPMKTRWSQWSLQGAPLIASDGRSAGLQIALTF